MGGLRHSFAVYSSKIRKVEYLYLTNSRKEHEDSYCYQIYEVVSLYISGGVPAKCKRLLAVYAEKFNGFATQKEPVQLVRIVFVLKLSGIFLLLGSVHSHSCCVLLCVCV